MHCIHVERCSDGSSSQLQLELPPLNRDQTLVPARSERRRAARQRRQRQRTPAVGASSSALHGASSHAAGVEGLHKRNQLGGLPNLEQVSTYPVQPLERCAGGCRECRPDPEAGDGPRFEFLGDDPLTGEPLSSDAFAWCWDEAGGFWSEEAEFQRPERDDAEPDPLRASEQTRGGEPIKPLLPGYIRNCANSKSPRKQRWYSNLWALDEPETTQRVPYSCNSWRCVGDCSDHQRHVLFSRLEQAFEDVDAQDVSLVVLTLDSPLHGLSGEQLDEVYKSLGPRTRKFFGLFRRLLWRYCTACRQLIGKAANGSERGNCGCTACQQCGEQPNRCYCVECSFCGADKGKRERCACLAASLPRRLDPFEREWSGIVEQHNDKTPHVNLTIISADLAEFLDSRRRARVARGYPDSTARYLAGWDYGGKIRQRDGSFAIDRDDVDREIVKLLRSCGLGFASTGERARSIEAVLNYSAKAAQNLDRVVRRSHQQRTAGERRAALQRRRELDAAALNEAEKQAERERLDQLVNELVKSSQLPVWAPRGFRRHRSGPLFLPPKQRNLRYTGTVLRRAGIEDADGVEVVRPLSAASDNREDLRLMQAYLADVERKLAWHDADALFADLRAPGEPVQKQKPCERWTHDVQTLVEMGVFDAIASMLQRRSAEAERKALAAAAMARQHDRPWAWRRLEAAERDVSAIALAQRELAATAAQRERFLPEERRRELEAGRELEAQWRAR